MNDSIYEQMIAAMLALEPSAVLLIDEQDHLQYCRFSGKRRLGEKLTGRPLPQILEFILKRDLAAQVMEAVRKVRGAGGSAELRRMEVEDAHGREYYLDMRLCRLLERHVVVFIKNITEFVLLENEFSTMLQEYEDSLEQLQTSIAKLELQLMKNA